ncbi:hypothetical protein, variant [Puccinia triticina 1-1 BBBD Race 1]|uniref:C2H2-type domain-containing protein n=2 Tax=Puccinia triticina TaxID=208348 RepID=A0A180H158_PUCT1|nr:hypothetical protein PTTG_25508 [Puccinia triticina 1-1 BBBD Race 1]OAV98788.1 hypothetical protein, variant [Puccinia triticina 1-1 BBBD Race 1]
MDGFDCQPCNRHFHQHAHYEDHLIHSARHHYCRPCQRDFGSASAKQAHLNHFESHAKCEWCQREFGQVGRLQHNAKYHEQCQKCDMWCHDDDMIDQHCARDHSDSYCSPCRTHFSNSNNLSYHLRSSAHQLKNIHCPHRSCSQGFVNKSSLIGHFEAGTCPSGVDLERVDDYFAYDCDPQELFVRQQMISPYRDWDIDEHDGRFPCPMCPKAFDHPGQLYAHHRSPKHKNDGEKPYICPSEACGEATFYSLSSLILHRAAGICEARHGDQLGKLIDQLCRMVERL